MFVTVVALRETVTSRTSLGKERSCKSALDRSRQLQERF